MCIRDSFAPDGTNIWYDYDFAHEIEGGDVLVLSSEIVAIGYSQRTSVAAIEKFAENALKNSTFKKVLVFDIPKCRAFMLSLIHIYFANCGFPYGYSLHRISYDSCIFGRQNRGIC